MDAQAITELLGALKAKHVTVRGKWVQCSCPLAPWYHDGKDERPSFAIRVEPTKASYFNCFVCKSGKLADLLAELQHLKAQHLGMDLGAAWKWVYAEDEMKLALVVKDWGGENPEEVEEYVIPEWWLETFPIAWPVPFARQYLESRMVDEQIAAKCDVRWDRSLRTVCFPVRNGEGELVSVRGRRIDPGNAPPYHVYTPSGTTVVHSWLGEHWIDWNRPVLTPESVFDLTSCLRVYDNVMAPLSVGINEYRMKRLAKATEVVTFFDQGKGGDKARAIVQKHMKSALVFHVKPAGKDPGVMTAAAIREQLQPYLKLKPLLTNATQ